MSALPASILDSPPAPVRAAPEARARPESPMHLEILDLDGSLGGHETGFELGWRSIRRVALRDLGPALRLWSRAATIERARVRLQAAGNRPDPTVTLVGSGDFHHLTALLLEGLREPTTVVHLDNHPDWVRLAPRWHCGSWVNQALRLPQVARVVTVGVCSDDLVWPGLKGGNLPALVAGRLRLLPLSHPPSRVLRRLPDGPSWRYQGGHMVWNNLADMAAATAIDTVLAQIATPRVWITIDKDVLREADAVCNWDQGRMSLAFALELIAAIGRRHAVVGADICGEYAPPGFSSAIKRWEAHRDQPRRPAPDALALERNRHTNQRLLRALLQAGAAC